MHATISERTPGQSGGVAGKTGTHIYTAAPTTKAHRARERRLRNCATSKAKSCLEFISVDPNRDAASCTECPCAQCKCTAVMGTMSTSYGGSAPKGTDD
eukprot:240365-Chlamydomonas_euryale.AAC.1